MRLNSLKYSLVLFVSVFLAACGGGGGSDPASLNPDNYVDAAALSFVHLEGVLEFADLARVSVERVKDHAMFPASEACSKGGSMDLDFIDSDMNSIVSSGDVVKIMFRDCFNSSTNGLLAGEAVIEIVPSDPLPPGTTGFVAVADFSDVAIDSTETEKIFFVGQMRVTFTRSMLEHVLHVEPANDSLSIHFEADGQVIDEVLTSLQAKKHLSSESARYSVDYTATVNSGILGVQFDISTVTPIGGYINTYPDQGELLAIAADNSQVRIQSNFTLPGYSHTHTARFELLEDPSSSASQGGNYNWESIVEGFIWYHPEYSRDWRGVNITGDGFTYLGPIWDDLPFSASERGINEPIFIQFSRPISAVGKQSISYRSGNPSIPDVVSRVEIYGALAVIYPSVPLKHGANYSIGNYSGWDMNGNWAPVKTFKFHTPDTLKAAINPNLIVAEPGGVISLNSSDSYAREGSIIAYEWTELSSTGAAISNGDQPTARITLPSTGEAVELSVMLTITHSNGETDSTVQQLWTIPDLSNVDYFYYQSDPYYFFGGGQTDLVSDLVGTFNITRNFTNGISIRFSGEPGMADWFMDFSAPNNDALSVGVYESATRWPFQDISSPGLSFYVAEGRRRCKSGSAMFEILEVSYDDEGNVLVFAADLIKACRDRTEGLRAYIRINSSIPVDANREFY